MLFIELLVSIVGLAFGLFLFSGAQQFPPATQPGLPGAAFFPVIISTIIAGLSLANLCIVLVKRKKIQGAGSDTAQDAQHVQFARKQILRVVGIVILTLLYALLWGYNIGHFIINSIVIFIPISMLYGGARERQWWKTSIYVVLLVVLIYVLFKYGLRVAII